MLDSAVMDRHLCDENVLAKELASAVIDDRRRKAVDEMKKRSVMTARSYDEFRLLVECAETGQKPVSRKEMEFLGKPTRPEGYLNANQRTGTKFGSQNNINSKLRSQSWNQVEKKSNQTVINSSEVVIPKSSHEFEKFWRRKDITNSVRFNILLGIDVVAVFKVEINNLDGILKCLREGLEDGSIETEVKVINFLKNLSSCGGVSLAVDFLSPSQLSQAQQLATKLNDTSIKTTFKI